MIGSAVAGTLHYAAPEQLDPDRSREVGPHSDVFGFGRTCYFALFREPYPDQEDLDTLPQPWKDFLGDALRRRSTAGRRTSPPCWSGSRASRAASEGRRTSAESPPRHPAR